MLSQMFGSNYAVNLGYKASAQAAAPANPLPGGRALAHAGVQSDRPLGYRFNLSEAKFLRLSLLDSRPAYRRALLPGEDRADRGREAAELEGERDRERERERRERGKPGVDS